MTQAASTDALWSRFAKAMGRWADLPVCPHRRPIEAGCPSCARKLEMDAIYERIKEQGGAR